MQKINKEQLKEMILRGDDVTQLDVSDIKDMPFLFKDVKSFNQDFRC